MFNFCKLGILVIANLELLQQRRCVLGGGKFNRGVLNSTTPLQNSQKWVKYIETNQI